MKKIKYLIIFLSLVITGCDSKWEMSDQDRVADHTILEFGETVACKGIRAIGIGGGINHQTGKLDNFGVTFITYEQVQDVARARELFVETADAFIDFINNHEPVQKYLDVHPVTILNIDMSIIFTNAQVGDIIDVFNCNKRLCYHKKVSQSEKDPWEKVLQETFEEAHGKLHTPGRQAPYGCL